MAEEGSKSNSEIASASPSEVDAVIRIQEVRKNYKMGDEIIRALDGVNCQINRNEYVAIMGPSGSGKSTCMHVLGCLDTPTSGEYQLDGEDVRRMARDDLARVRRSKVGFVFQAFNLMAGATAQANVELPLLYSGAPRVERAEKAARALDAVGLADRRHHLPTQLSGGQMQRVAIARALVSEPSLLLADEPTGNLDTRSASEIMDVIDTLNTQRGITTILVTHEHEVARRARRIIRFRDGRIEKDELVQ